MDGTCGIPISSMVRFVPTFELKMSEDQRHEWEPYFSHEFAQKRRLQICKLQPSLRRRTSGKNNFGAETETTATPLHDKSISSVGEIVVNIID